MLREMLHACENPGAASRDALKQLICDGADVNMQQAGGRQETPLHQACLCDNPDCAHVLLEAGAATGCLNWMDFTPLGLALQANSASCVRLLLAASASPNQKSDSRPPLVFAVGETKVRELGTAPQTSDECVQLLLEAGAWVDEPDTAGGTPLYIASKHRRQGCIDLLLSRRANPCLAEKEYNQTPLYFACLKGSSDCTRRHIGCVVALCEGMTDSEFVECINTHEELDGMTPLHAAAELQDGDVGCLSQDEQCLRALLEKGGGLLGRLGYLDVTNDDGYTPLHFACGNGYIPSARLLIAAQADVNWHDNEQRWTPLAKAAMCGQPGSVQLLIESKADVNVLDYSGCTALAPACFFGHERCAKLMISAGVDLSDDVMMSDPDRSPFLLALKEGHQACARLVGEARKASKKKAEAKRAAQEAEAIRRAAAAESAPRQEREDASVAAAREAEARRRQQAVASRELRAQAPATQPLRVPGPSHREPKTRASRAPSLAARLEHEE